MPLINLIKEQRQKALKKERQVQFALMGTLGVGALCLVMVAAFMLDGARLNMRAAALEQQKRDLEPLIQELDTTTAEIERLQPRIKTLEEAQTHSAKWGRILDHLTTNTPDGTYLSTLKAFQQDRTKPLVVTMIGVSSTNELVGDLLLRLEMCEDLENVTLKYTQPRFVEGGKQLDFEIDADVVGTSENEDQVKEVNG